MIGVSYTVSSSGYIILGNGRVLTSLDEAFEAGCPDAWAMGQYLLSQPEE